MLGRTLGHLHRYQTTLRMQKLGVVGPKLMVGQREGLGVDDKGAEDRTIVAVIGVGVRAVNGKNAAETTVAATILEGAAPKRVWEWTMSRKVEAGRETVRVVGCEAIVPARSTDPDSIRFASMVEETVSFCEDRLHACNNR